MTLNTGHTNANRGSPLIKQSQNHYLNIGTLKYHVRTWGEPHHPHLYLLHGWMDMSASFQFTVDALESDWFVIAPDWRGFGLSDWSKSTYWFPDYVADLQEIVDHFSKGQDINMVGHSMGGNIAGLFCGVYPNRVSRLVLAEGFGMPPTEPDQAPDRLKRWLEQRKKMPTLKPYGSLAEVAARLITNTPSLREDRATFLAEHWARKRSDGAYELRADPKHKMVNPILYRADEAFYFWKEIDCATMWLHSDSDWLDRFLKGDKSTIEKYRSCYKQLVEKTIPDSTHMMHHVQPEAFAKTIEAFLDSQDDLV